MRRIVGTVSDVRFPASVSRAIVPSRMTHLTERLRDLYEGDSDRAHRFRYLPLVFDLTTLAFIVVSSFMPQQPLVEGLDVVIGVAVAADFASRLAMSPRRWCEFLRPTTWADVLFSVIVQGSTLGFVARRTLGKCIQRVAAGGFPRSGLRTTGRPVSCRVTDRPDRRFDVVATISPNKVFRREGLMPRAEADASVAELLAIMAAFGAPVLSEPAAGTEVSRRAPIPLFRSGAPLFDRQIVRCAARPGCRT